LENYLLNVAEIRKNVVNMVHFCNFIIDPPHKEGPRLLVINQKLRIVELRKV